MPVAQSLRESITASFIRELEVFKRGGYKFSGTDKKLFEGTQQEAFDAYLKDIKSGKAHGYFEIPTGVGKTAIFIAIVTCYLKAIENIPNAPRVLIHEPTTDLVLQTAKAFANFAPEIAKTMMEADDEQGREIDWEKSEIDIHYSGRKGAKNVPKVLITTYQSQAADNRKIEKATDKETAIAKRTYKPEDFHLVIHDEAHYLTGPKYGPATVDKFSEAIQLGLTATPEYSKDKTVANKLEHRYYHLPITAAMERGDLCPARPILIKTKLSDKDKIKLEKAREFFEQQKGKPLTNKQLEQLYNQEARNKAIIKAYLTGSHPETGKRYLEMTGMIFAGGITHCNDFITHTERVLNQSNYRDVKRWLKDEGLCLIAPVHSKVPEEGLDLTIGGEKRKCTKEQIKELHRQGKILLLISDQELKLGTDYPADEFGADAVDRFSVPDAAQRTGRLLRVDRGDEDYNRPKNLNKYSALLNVIDETTHEMYKGTLHHPIHAIEVLHGAKHRPPARRIGAITRFKNHPPEVSEAMEELGFEFITRMEAIKGVQKKLVEGKKKKLPEKDGDWLAAVDTADSEIVPGGNRVPLKKAVQYLTGESSPYDVEKLGIQAIEYKGQSINLQKMQAGPAQPICIYRAHWDRVEKAAGVDPAVTLPDKNKDWLSTADTLNTTILPGGQRTLVQETIKYLTGKSSSPYDTKANGIQTIQYNGQFIDLQKMQSGVLQPICIRRAHWDRVEKAAGVEPAISLPKKDEHWLSLVNTLNVNIILGGGRTPIKKVVQYLTGKSSPYDMQKLGLQTIEYNGQLIDLQKMQSGVSQPICIRREHWDRVEKAAGVEPAISLPKKDEHWLSANETQDSNVVFRGNRQPIQAAVKYLTSNSSSPYDMQRLGVQTIKHNGQFIDLQKMQVGTRQSICIRREHWDRVEKAAEVEAAITLPKKDEHWLSTTDTRNLEFGGGRASIIEAVKYLTDEESSPYDVKKGGIQTIEYKGQYIDLQKMQSYTRQVICIRRTHWNKVESAARVESVVVLPKKDEHWLSLNDTANSDIVAGGQRKPVAEVLKYLTGEFSPYDVNKLGIQAVEYNGQFIDLQKMQSGPNQSICVRRAHWDRVEEAAGVKPAVTLPKKDKNWLSSSDTEDSDIILGGGRVPIEEVVKYLTGKSSPYDVGKCGVQTFEYNKQFIDLQKMQSGTQQPICIRRAHWDRVEKAAGVESLHTDESLKSPPITKKEITPGSKDLKRTGRSRAASEE